MKPMSPNEVAAKALEYFKLKEQLAKTKEQIGAPVFWVLQFCRTFSSTARANPSRCDRAAPRPLCGRRAPEPARPRNAPYSRAKARQTASCRASTDDDDEEA